ncbi:MAG: anthranilate synthase component I, partial [Rhabdaerophilum sp.]
MLATPDFDAFERLYRAGQPQCVAVRLISDLETPVSTYLKLKTLIGDQPSFLLESVEGGAVKGRHSIIGLLPDLI